VCKYKSLIASVALLSAFFLQTPYLSSAIDFLLSGSSCSSALQTMSQLSFQEFPNALLAAFLASNAAFSEATFPSNSLASSKCLEVFQSQLRKKPF
jgi:hypothetical protein